MSAYIVRLLLICISLFVPGIVSAQSVESVLRALQERNIALEWRRSYSDPSKTTVTPIVWPGTPAAFPADGSISSFPDTIAALNAASSVFDGIKREFLAYDSRRRRFINLRHSTPNEIVETREGADSDGEWITSDDGFGYPGGSYYIGSSGFYLSSIDLPSVGQFDEQTWRSKLQVLASNINQLKALTWPVRLQAATASFGTYPDWNGSDGSPRPIPPTSFDGEDGGKALEWTIDFPNFVSPSGTTYVREKAAYFNQFTGSDGVTYDYFPYWPFQLRDGGSYWGPVNDGGPFYLSHAADSHADLAFSWRVFADAQYQFDRIYGNSQSGFGGNDYLECITGIRPTAGPAREMPSIPGAPILTGEWAFFKGPSVAGFGDLTEAVCRKLKADSVGGSDTDPMEGKLALGLMAPLSDAPVNASTLGTVSDTPSTAEQPSEFGSRGSAVEQTFGWLGIPKLSISGVLASLPQEFQPEAPNSDTVRSSYAMAFDKGAKIRRGFGFGELHVRFKTVFLPRFTLLTVAPERVAPFVSPGTVEPTVTFYEMARIHLGRGLSDPQQTAWLGMRPDGFGSMIFHGSPEQFELLYEEDFENFADEPLGGRTFDSALEFTETQRTQSGWPHRFAYISEWFSPRLKQVKGGDVLVTINYDTCYKKVLYFSWAKDAGGFDGQFYTLPGPAFKVIEILNPTAPLASSGLPTEQNHLRIIEDNTRFHELRYEYNLHTSELLEDREVFHFKCGSTPDGAESGTRVTLKTTWPEGERLPWEYEQTADGQTSLTKVGWDVDGYAHPLLYVQPRPTFMERVSTGHRVDYEWQSAGGIYVIPKKVSYSGATDWELNGDLIEFRLDGLVDKATSKMGSKPHVVSHEWNGNARTSTYKLDGVAYRTERAAYLDKLSTVELSAGGDAVGTFKYNIGGQLEIAEYPGGYKEAYTSVKNDDGWSKTVRSGWGSGFASGRTTTTQLSDFGAAMSRVVQSSEGVFLAIDVGSDFTGWGAPRKIQHLRGNETEIFYEEFGVNWGKTLTCSDATGFTTGVTGYDWRSRVTGLKTGFDDFTANYQEPLKPKFSVEGGAWFQNTYSPLGELQSREEDNGALGSFKIGKVGDSYVKVDGRSVALGVDTAGVVRSVSNGLGSRGGEFDFGVANGMLYTETIPYTKTGAKSATKIRTYYDGKGRVKLKERPGENGAVTETWTYDDMRRSVTYSPGVGPVAQNIESTISENGAEVMVTKGGIDYLRYTRKVQNGELVRITERFNDSSGNGSRWDEVARETFDPASGISSFTPWGLATNTTTTIEGTPAPESTTTIADGATGNSLQVTLIGGEARSVLGTLGGVPVDINLGWTKDVLTETAGSIAGKAVSMTMGRDGRPLSLTGPGTSKTFVYGGQPAFSVSISDTVQNTGSLITADAVADLTGVAQSGSIPLSLNTQDTPSGRFTRLSVPGATAYVEMNTNHLGSLTGKSYSGGIGESYSLNSDGSLNEVTKGLQQGEYISATIQETATSRKTKYSDAEIVEQFYYSGPRSSVSAPNDARTFTYENFQLRTETHTSGPWEGWTVERIPDAKGRLDTLRLKNSALRREFSFRYDDYSRLSDSVSYKVIGSYSHNPTTGQIETLTRDSLHTTWGYDNIGRLASLTNVRTGIPSFNFSYPDRDQRHRITRREVSIGRPWTDLNYDNSDQLKGVDVGNGRSLAYGHDARGNRGDQGVAASHTINGLDQISLRVLNQRGFGLLGAVHPQASVLAFNSFVDPSGIPLVVKATGEFGYYQEVDPSWADGKTGLVTTRIRGTLIGAGANGSNATAEEELYFLIPPVNEEIVSDNVGRTKSDAFWSYSWTDSGNLRQLTRRPGTFRRPNMVAEVVEFVYDADGRRTQKTRTVTLGSGATQVENSKVLWSGWLPVMEERSRDGKFIDRRVFQWGADISGSLEGAGGIGGLVAIIEEKASGKVRTLLPIQDGLGNVTAVLDQATGATVARYDYGPFGEPLGETGEADACPFRFQTKWYDAESEHYYFGYRYYSPRLGRWLSRDPLGESGGVNLYAYCGNDPVNRHDPLGLSTMEDWQNYAADPNTSFLAGLGIYMGTTALDFFSMGSFSRNSALEDQYLAGEITGNQFGSGLAVNGGSALAVTLATGGTGSLMTKAGAPLWQVAAASGGVGAVVDISSRRAGYGLAGLEYDQTITQDGLELTGGVVGGAVLGKGVPWLGTQAYRGLEALRNVNWTGGGPRNLLNYRLVADGLGTSGFFSVRYATNTVPSIRGGAFANWFNGLSSAEFDVLWANPSMRAVIERRLRAPGGMHEWHMVARAPKFKAWGVTAEQIAGMRTEIGQLRFKNPAGSHGQAGSGIWHNELLDLIDNANSYDAFVRALRVWADNRLVGGAVALPPGLRP